MNRHQRQLCFTFKYYDKRGAKKVASKLKLANGLSKVGFEVMANDLEDLPQALGNGPVCIGQEKKINRTSPNHVAKRVKKRGRPATLSQEQAESPDQQAATEPVQKKRKKVNPAVLPGDKVSEGAPLTKEIVKDLTDQPANGIVTPPRLNGDFPTYPVNGELSPNSTLKMKIRKVRPAANSGPGKKKRGRPPKVRETFVIVNPPNEERPEAAVRECDAGSLGMTVNGACLDKSPTPLTLSVPAPKKRGRPRKLPVASVPEKVKKPGNSKQKQGDIEKGKENVSSGLQVTPPEKEGSTDDDVVSAKNVLRRDKDVVCVVCEQLDNLIFCEGICGSAYHADCIGLSSLHKQKFICDECTTGNHSCFACKQTGDVKQCSQPNCTKFYHESCLKPFKTARFDGDRFICPFHACSTCAVKKTTVAKGKLARCVRCPTAYHMAGCLVAGCISISPYLMTCAKHFMPDKNKAHHSHVNVNWCFVCSIGGTLICCESCPAAFHPECISYEGIPDGHFFCKDCIEGRQHLFGDIVWVKLGMYR